MLASTCLYSLYAWFILVVCACFTKSAAARLVFIADGGAPAMQPWLVAARRQAVASGGGGANKMLAAIGGCQRNVQLLRSHKTSVIIYLPRMH